MASFITYSKDGDSNFLIQRLIREGHDARVFIHNKESKDVGRGLVPLVNTFNPRRGDIIIFDMIGFGYLADRLRRQGYKVISGGSLGDRLEYDRGFAIQVMRDAGIAVPETSEFSNTKDALRFLAKQKPEESYYLKPSGDENCASTHCGKDVEDMVRWIAYLVKKKEVPKKFLLQKKMDSSAELSFEGWFDGDKWVLPWNSTIEDKRLLVGDVGPNTGCMANLVWAYESPMPLLAMRTLTRLTPILRAGKYCSPFDINVIFGADGTPHSLEFTARPGYLALQALVLLIGGDLGSQLWEFANGTLSKFEVATDQYSLAIGVSVPPYPNHDLAPQARWTPVDPKLLYDPIRIMPTDLMLVNRGLYVTGCDASVAVFGDTWHDLDELRRMVLDNVKRFAIPDAQYRVDPVERAEREFEFLKEHDYEVPMPRTEYRPPIEFDAPIPNEFVPQGIEGNSEASTRDPNMSPNISHFDTGGSSGPEPSF